MERRKVETRVQARRTESAPTSQPRQAPNKTKRKETETSNRHQGPLRRCRQRGVVEGKTLGRAVCCARNGASATQSNQLSHVDSRPRQHQAEPSVRCDAPNRMSAGERKHRSSNLESTRNMAPMPVDDKTSRSGPTALARPNMESLNTAHRLPCSVLFTHPDRRFQHCVNGPPFSDDKTSGGGVETERRTEMTIMLVSAGWGSRRGGGVRESIRGRARGAERPDPTQGRPKRWLDRRVPSQSKTSPGQRVAGHGAL